MRIHKTQHANLTDDELLAFARLAGPARQDDLFMELFYRLESYIELVPQTLKQQLELG